MRNVYAYPRLADTGLDVDRVGGYGAEKFQSSIENEMTQERKRLEHSRKKSPKSKEKATKAEKQHGSVLKNIEQLDQRLYRTKKERNRIDAEIREKDQELAKLSTNISDLENNVQTHREAVTARLRLCLYIDGQAATSKHCLPRKLGFAGQSHGLYFLDQLNESMLFVPTIGGKVLASYNSSKTSKPRREKLLLALQGETQSTIKGYPGLKRRKHHIW